MSILEIEGTTISLGYGGEVSLIVAGKKTRYKGTRSFVDKFNDGTKYWFLRSPNGLNRIMPEVNRRSVTDAVKRGRLIPTYIDGRLFIDVLFPKNQRWLTLRGTDLPTHFKRVLQLRKAGNGEEVVRLWDTISDTVKYGFHAGHVVECCKGKAHTHKGFIWRYYDVD